jgi:hypothetical protein
MNAVKNNLLRMVAVLFFFLTAITSSAQGVDKVYMLNGQVNEGKVTAVNAGAIKFIYKGETLEYEFNKADINKIVFASGREDVINSPNSVRQAVTSSPADRKGKIAVLPFKFTTNDQQLTLEDMQHRIQGDTSDSFRHDATGLVVIDPMQINAILAQNGITEDNIMAKTPQDLAALLGAQYVVYGVANITNKGSQNYGSTVTTSKDKYGATTTKGSSVTSTSGTTLITYGTNIDLKIYNDTGASVHSSSRESFGTELDSYKATIKYLVKRTPFGTKSK